MFNERTMRQYLSTDPTNLRLNNSPSSSTTTTTTLDPALSHHTMACRFGLYEFVNEDNALEIGDASRIVGKTANDLKNDTWDIDSVCQVNWPMKNGKVQKVAARVLRFSNNRTELKDVLDQLLDGGDLATILEGVENLGRGQRGKRPAKRGESSSSDDEIEEQPRKTVKKNRVTSEKRVQQDILDILKERTKEKEILVPSQSQSEVGELWREVADLRRAVADLQETNKALMATNESLVATVSSLAGLPSLVEKLSDLLQAQQRPSPPTVSPQPQQRTSPPTHLDVESPGEPTTHHQDGPSVTDMTERPSSPTGPPAIDDASRDGMEGVTMEVTSGACEESSFSISPGILSRVDKADARKMTNTLLQSLYSEEFLSSHSVGGGKRAGGLQAKPGMDPIHVREITNSVRQQFPLKTTSEIKFFMREKLNNAAKNLKRRQLQK